MTGPRLVAFLADRIVDEYHADCAGLDDHALELSAARLKATSRLNAVFSMALDALQGEDLALREQAVKYADHPDYRPEWRP